MKQINPRIIITRINTICGWTLQGFKGEDTNCCMNFENDLSKIDINKFREIESLENPNSSNDENVKDQFKSSIHRNRDGRYSVSFQ